MFTSKRYTELRKNYNPILHLTCLVMFAMGKPHRKANGFYPQLTWIEDFTLPANNYSNGKERIAKNAEIHALPINTEKCMIAIVEHSENISGEEIAQIIQKRIEENNKDLFSKLDQQDKEKIAEMRYYNDFKEETDFWIKMASSFMHTEIDIRHFMIPEIFPNSDTSSDGVWGHFLKKIRQAEEFGIKNTNHDPNLRKRSLFHP